MVTWCWVVTLRVAGTWPAPDAAPSLGCPECLPVGLGPLRSAWTVPPGVWLGEGPTLTGRGAHRWCAGRFPLGGGFP